MKLKSEYGPIVLRISLSLVFLWFGINQVFSPSAWTSFVPNSLSKIMPLNTIVFINGSFEILFGLMLIIGFYTRFASLLLGVHLFGIASSMGFNAIAIRDYGLALATISLFLMGPDKLCLDTRLKKKNENPQIITEEKISIISTSQ